MTLNEKQIVGSLFGSCNIRSDIPRLFEMYVQGKFNLDALITNTYTLDEINDGYDAMRNGENVRGSSSTTEPDIPTTPDDSVAPTGSGRALPERLSRAHGLVVLAPAGDDVEARAFGAAVGASVAGYDGPSSVPAALTHVLDALH